MVGRQARADVDASMCAMEAAVDSLQGSLRGHRTRQDIKVMVEERMAAACQVFRRWITTRKLRQEMSATRHAMETDPAKLEQQIQFYKDLKSEYAMSGQKTKVKDIKSHLTELEQMYQKACAATAEA